MQIDDTIGVFILVFHPFLDVILLLYIIYMFTKQTKLFEYITYYAICKFFRFSLVSIQ